MKMPLAIPSKPPSMLVPKAMANNHISKLPFILNSL
jgi:hypothetical protein